MIDEKMFGQVRLGAATSLVIAVCIVILLALIPAVHAESGQPTVFIESYTITPQVLAPGDYGTITAIIKNTASSATIQESSGATSGGGFTSVKSVDIPVQIDSVSLEGNGIIVISNSFNQFGSLGPGQSAIVSFAIQAPNKEGIFFPEIWVDINGGKNVRYPVTVNINAKSQVLRAPTIVVTKSLPDSVNPGDNFSVLLDIKNAGVLRAGQILMTINTSSSSIGVKGSNTLVLNDLEGGLSKSTTIDFITDNKAPIGLQKVNLFFNYQLPDGTTQNQTEVIEVPIKGKAELGFVTVDTNPPRLTENTPFDLTIRIENTGTGEAKQVSATIDLPVEGKKEAFIGKIKPGNDAPAIFLLEGAKAGTIPYILTITYTDDMGEHVIKRQMSLRVTPTDITGDIVLVLIVLAIIGFVGYRYWYLPKVNGDGKFPWERKS
ncbi:MAG: hypothetical protein A4E35_00290 [Methanoregula sp. PtaU1.Bin051]|nr:MAG: hypothetical protein A4E35_00290 [Methanoregula sp. PtaU1.Bin051]